MKNYTRMNVDIVQFIPEYFNDNSKVWIYQSNRPFLKTEVIEIENILHNYVQNWKSHGAEVKGFSSVLFDYFIILIADESETMVSGCSTDSSVHIIKTIEEKFAVNLFDRQNLTFLCNDNIVQIPLPKINNAIKNKTIEPTTLFFNNAITTKKQLLTEWIVPINKSWLHKKITTQPA
jgi:hypothetical protein